ncbi:hypothetical protein FCV25MIE_00207 [Fagus crenata]
MPPGSSISMYGRRICANGIWFGRHLLNLVRLLVSAGFGAFAISRSSDEVEADTKWCDGAVGKSSLTASSSHGRFDNVMKTSVEHTCTREIDECPRFDLVLRKIS